MPQIPSGASKHNISGVDYSSESFLHTSRSVKIVYWYQLILNQTNLGTQFLQLRCAEQPSITLHYTLKCAFSTILLNLSCVRVKKNKNGVEGRNRGTQKRFTDIIFSHHGS